MVPNIDDVFGPYKILGPLGTGGMGMVFRAQDTRLHREVAVKVLADHLNVPAMKERFLREARAASALNHPNICTLFDIGEQDGTPYLVMELLQGETMKELCAGNPLPPEHILNYGAQAADALAAAHAKGVVHRDVKSANIFVVSQQQGDAQIKILDFGLAKMDSADTLVTSSGQLLATTHDQGLTTPGSTVGTVAYMSPEQAKGEPLDPRTDIFSFGSVLYEMATGMLPFPGATSALVFVGLLSKEPASIRAAVPGFPPELEQVILRCLEKERGDRYQTARELRQDLLRLTSRESSGDHAIASSPRFAVAPASPPSSLSSASSATRAYIAQEPASRPSSHETPTVETTRADFMRSGLSSPAEPKTSRTRSQQRESPFVHEEDLASLVNIPVAKKPAQTSSGDVSIPAPAKLRVHPVPFQRPAEPSESLASASPSEPRAKSNTGAIIGILVLLVLIVGGLTYYHFAALPKTAGNAEEPSATAAAPTINATPQAVREYLNAGQLATAVTASQAILNKDPQSAEGFALKQESLARTDKFEAAHETFKAALDAPAAVMADPAKAAAIHAQELITARLFNDPRSLDAQLAWAPTSSAGYLVTIAHGYVLQDQGQTAAAITAWQNGANAARRAGDTNAAASALAASVLANALIGNCSAINGQANAALSMHGTARGEAKAGIALGLCHDSAAASVVSQLLKDHADDPLVKALYTPEITAAIAVGAKDGATALHALQGVQKYDLGSLAPYLRGLANLETKQPNLAIGDFQAILIHRGAFVAGRLLCYPLALAQLAKSYQQLGDPTNAAIQTERLRHY